MPERTQNLDVAIIDYQMSNLFSVQAACKKVGLTSEVTSDVDTILSAKGAILPGVGAFGEAMEHLQKLKLDSCIKRFIESGKPFMGVCLGLQLLFSDSEEFGSNKGLNIIEGHVQKFDFINESGEKFPVPHIGWNRIKKQGVSWNNTLLKDNSDLDFMYFVHSFYVKPKDSSIVAATTEYGPKEFCSAITINNLSAFQFHPEKSGEDGIRVYKNFKNVVYKGIES